MVNDTFEVAIAKQTKLYKALPNDGSELAEAILWADVDATAAAKPGAAVMRDAEVTLGELTWPAGISTNDKDMAISQLAELGIICR